MNFYIGIIFRILSIFFYFSSAPLLGADVLRLGIPIPSLVFEEEENNRTYPNMVAPLDVLAAAGFHVVTEYMPLSRIYSELKNGMLDLALGTKSLKQNSRDYLISTIPISEVKMVIVARPGITLPENLEAIVQKSVGLLRGYTYPDVRDFLEDSGNNNEIENLSTSVSGLRMVAAGRLDYFIVYETSLSSIDDKEFVRRLQKKTLRFTPLYFVLSKKNAQAVEVLERIERAHIALIKKAS
jgi:ABC-type amino acid transport substrate-binding protein